MAKIAKMMLIVVAMGAIIVGATKAYFSDTETSNGNSFDAGTLDLNIDGTNTNIVKFSQINLRPGNQPKGSWTLSNVGSLSGYLDIENVVVTTSENGILDMEEEAGDTTASEGELDDVLNCRLFLDLNGDGWISVGDITFYNGKVKDIPSHFELDQLMPAGSNLKIVGLFDWWSSADDNLAQGDGFDLDMTFELAQTAGQ